MELGQVGEFCGVEELEQRVFVGGAVEDSGGIVDGGHGAGADAGNDVGFEAEFIEGAHGPDVGESAGAATAQGNA